MKELIVLNIQHIKKLVNSGKIKYIVRNGDRLNLEYAMFKKVPNYYIMIKL